MDPQLAQIAEIGWSPDLRVTSAEGACEAVFGRAAPELLGRLLAEVFGIPPRRAEELDARAKAAGGAVEFVTSSAHEPHTFRLAMGLRGGGPRAGVLDLTAALAGAPPIQISHLSSSLSHEIRNPLSSVKMAVQTVAKNPALGDRDQRRLRIANREIRTMERMLSLLSEYGREAPPIPEAVPARTVVTEGAALVEPELAEREIRLEISEDPPGSKVRADVARLRPVIAQLLLNVASGLSQGAALEVLIRPFGAGVSISVTDKNAAVPPEERATLFEPFGSRLARGAGLSLAALHRAMLAQGGAVEVEEVPGQGAEIRLLFPA